MKTKTTAVLILILGSMLFGSKPHKTVQFWAKKNNCPVRIDDGENVAELVAIGRNNRPIYLRTLNYKAAVWSGAQSLWPEPEGDLGFGLTGENTTVAIWDGGLVALHQEFDTPDSSRIVHKDTGCAIHHATHVAGTIGARGFDYRSHGMAPKVTIMSYEWMSDMSEISEESEKGLSLSNHSYGIVAGWIYGRYSGNYGWHWLGDIRISREEDYCFGFYDFTPHHLDRIMHDNPYYLMIQAAGNERGDGWPGNGNAFYYADYDQAKWVRTNEFYPEPDGGIDGYDSLLPRATSKNGITVGAAKKDNYGNIIIASFSSWGPTDDGRIKPDVVAKGVNQFSSTFSSSDTTDLGRYCYSSGTSMSTPVVTGVCALLQDYHSQEKSSPMLSATMKAVIIHTAKDCGNLGPDYVYGWGFVKADLAAKKLRETFEENKKTVRELELNVGGEYTCKIIPNDDQPLKVTICWTDLPGPPSDIALNPRERRLVNDLDLHLEDAEGNTYYPWTLDLENPSEDARRDKRNELDNVEQVFVEAPKSSYYKIVVNHSGDLVEGKQSFSLVFDGKYKQKEKKEKEEYERIPEGPLPLPDSLFAENENIGIIPIEFKLSHNYPNPFNPRTTVEFSIDENGPVKLAIYDITGKLVETLIDKNLPIGYHSVSFDARDLPSGTYFYRLITKKEAATKKMLLVK